MIMKQLSSSLSPQSSRVLSDVILRLYPNQEYYEPIIEKVNGNLFKISKRSNAFWSLNALGDEKIADFFIKEPEKLIEAFDLLSPEGFSAISAPIIQLTFLKSPKKIVRAFEKIDNQFVAPRFIYYMFDDDEAAKFFIRNPKRFLFFLKKISKITDQLGFFIISHPDIVKIFVNDPWLLIEYFRKLSNIAGSKDEDLFAVFQILTNEKIIALFIKDPPRFIEFFSSLFKHKKMIQSIYSFVMGSVENRVLFIAYYNGEISFKYLCLKINENESKYPRLKMD